MIRAAPAIVSLLAGYYAAPPPVPSSARLLGLARTVEQAVNARDAQAVDRFVDRRALARRAMEGLDVTVGERLAVTNDISHSLALGAMLTGAVGHSGHYRFLAVREVGGSPRALFRAVSDQGGLNYHDLVLGRGDRGEPIIVDAYAWLSGERLSDTLHRACERRLYAARGRADRVGPAARMDRVIDQGWYEQGLRLFESLRPDGRTDRTLLIQRMVCAGHVGPDALDAACADFRRAYPGDPCADLFMLDALLDAGRCQEALGAVDRIRRAIHDDPWLDGVAARVLLASGSLDRARAFAQRFVEAEPDLEQAWSLRLRVALAQRDHRATAGSLAALHDRFGYRFRHLESLPEYSQFVESDEYPRWLSEVAPSP